MKSGGDPLEKKTPRKVEGGNYNTTARKKKAKNRNSSTRGTARRWLVILRTVNAEKG